MGIRLQILLTVLGAVIVFSLLWSVTIYQTRSARTILTAALTDSETSSRAVLSFQQSWLNRIQIIDAYLHGTLSIDQARDQGDAAKVRMDQEINRIEKSFAVISQRGITDFKSQKNVRELKDAAEFAENMQSEFLGGAPGTGATASAEKINVFITGISQQKEHMHTIVSETDDANREMIRRAGIPLATAIRWWPFLLVICILLSGIIAWLNARFVSVTFNRLTQEVYQSLYPEGDTSGAAPQPPPNLFAMVRQLVEKNKANVELVKTTIAQRDQSMDKIKMGLERTIADQKRQYEEKIQELSSLNKAMIGRELKMARLKQQMEEMKRKLGTTDAEPA